MRLEITQKPVLYAVETYLGKFETKDEEAMNQVP